MLKIVSLGFALSLSAASVSSAAMLPAPIDAGASAVERAAENCGAGKWRDSYGHCRWFHTAGGSDRGTRHACPPGHAWMSGRCVPI